MSTISDEPFTPLVESDSVSQSFHFGSLNDRCRILLRRRMWLLVAVANVIFIYFMIHQFRVHKVIQDKILKRIEEAISEPSIIPKLDPLPYIINTSSCKIPDFNPWDESLKLLSTKCTEEEETEPNCRRKNRRNWMFSNTTHLFVNTTAIVESGYSWQSLHCCYREIFRVEQSQGHYDKKADSTVKYSSSCHKIQSLVTPIRTEFIRAFCISTSTVSSLDVVYRQFFSFYSLDSHALEKVKKWDQLKVERRDLPPNVVVLVVDTNSRLNTHRRLNKTLKVLGDINANEFFGYTKVAENTYPNTVAFLTGMDEASMTSTCRPSAWDVQDTCPYVWNNFDQAGYLTSTTEDIANGATFNYLKTGFLRKPTDFYYRTLMVALKKQPRPHPWFTRCIGPYQPDEMLLNYVLNILEGSANKAPAFIHNLLVTFTHGCINGARFVDGSISGFVKTVAEKYPNTILFLMSDHGDRYGKFRESLMGFYEDKLPSMWIHLPQNLRERFPSWNDALAINSRRLTSHFDLYQTLIHILDTFTVNNSSKVEESETMETNGQSLFRVVPENRTCKAAHIPDSYCACVVPKVLDITNLNSTTGKLLEKAAGATTKYLEKVLPKKCAKLKLKELVSAKVMQSLTNEVYVISFYTDPGDFLFEVTTTRASPDEFVVNSLSDILRMNKIDNTVICVEDQIHERYCHCK